MVVKGRTPTYRRRKMSADGKPERNLAIELAAAMIKAGVDYALNHQGELIAAFGKPGGKSKGKRDLPAKAGA
jgi:hypothetical protein